MASSFSSNDIVADYIGRLSTFSEIRDITANVFTDKRDVVETIINDNNVDGELWSKNDFVTMENELADDEGRRVSSMHTTTLAVRNSTVTSPFFDPDTGDLENAMVVQGNVPVSEYLDQTPISLDSDIQKALAKQLSFGLDSAAGVMKNCIAAHNVIHSLLLSALMYFRAKIVENGSSLADNEEGKIMAICRVADTLAEISSLVQEAKKVSYNLADEGKVRDGGGGDAYSVVVGEKYIDLNRSKLPVRCNFCNVAGHGPTPLLGQFSGRLQEKYIERNDDIVKEKRSAVQKGGFTDIFITRSSGASQDNDSIASKAASAAIQHNYTVNTSERSSVECAFKRAKFDSQVGHLMQNYMDSRFRHLECQQQQQQQQYYYKQQQQHETPGQICAVTEERERENECKYEVLRDSEQEDNKEKEDCEESNIDEITGSSVIAPSLKAKQKEENNTLSPERDNANQLQEVAAAVAAKDNREKIYPPDGNGGEQPNVRIVQRIDAKAPQTFVQHEMMQQSLASGYVSPIHSSAPQRQTTSASTVESGPALGPGYAESTRPRPLSFISPIQSPERATAASTIEPGPALPPGYTGKMKPLRSPMRSPSTTALLDRVLEPSQSETNKAAFEIHRLEMIGLSPSLPAIRGRDRQNRASMEAVVKKFGRRGRYK